jgi:hypothetical protein
MKHIGCENRLLYPRQKGTFRDMNYSLLTGNSEAIPLCPESRLLVTLPCRVQITYISAAIRSEALTYRCLLIKVEGSFVGQEF